MAERVYLHVGLPKTGTTYLQSVLWANRRLLRERGVLIPGGRPRDHLRASMVVRQHPRLAREPEEVRGAWSRLLAESAGFEGTSIISHEFLAAATEEQTRLAVEQIGAAEVHVVVTARDPLKLVTSRWQEYVKHGFDKRLEHFPPDVPAWNEWGWSTIDVESVLRRWGAAVPAERMHLLVLPGREAPRDALFTLLADVVGFDPAGLDTTVARANESMGVVETEFMRRATRGLEGFSSSLDRGVWLRSYLAQEKLVPRGGEPFLPSPARVAHLREMSRRTVEAVERSGIDVRGDLERLLVPEQVEPARPPESVTEQELLEVALATVQALLPDVRTFRSGRNALDREVVRLEHEVAALRAAAEQQAARPTGAARLALAGRRAVGRVGRQVGGRLGRSARSRADD